MAETFANLVARVSADNTELESGMRQSEQIVKGSADNMAGSLTTVTSAAAITTGGVTTMSRSFAIMGAAGTLAGSQLGGMASGVAALGGSVAALGIVINPIVLAIAALGVVAYRLIDPFGEVKNAVDEVSAGLTSQIAKTQDAGMAFGVATGQLSEYAAEWLKATRSMEGATQGEWTEFNKQFGEEQAFKERTAGVLADQAAIAEMVARQAIDTAAIEASEKQRAATMQNLQDQLAISQGTDPLTLGNMPMAERLLLLRIRETNEMKAQAEIEKSLVKSQEDRIRALGQQLQITAGLAKATDFIDDSYERQLAEAMAAINGGVAMPDRTTTSSGFSIGSRPSEQFRFGGARAGGEAIGQQTEQAKQTVILKTIEEKVTVAIEVLKKLPPDVLKTAGINLGTLGYGGGLSNG